MSNNNAPKGGGGGHMGPGSRAASHGRVKFDKDTGSTAKRLLAYIAKGHVLQLILVFLCIIVEAFVTVKSALFIGSLIDDYIKPLLLQGADPDFGPLLYYILTMAGLYIAGVAAQVIYQLIMVKISQTILNDIRNNLFSKLQTLPIKYFDTHPYGDIMSRFTNDADSLRQMLSQSIPNLFSSLITIVSVLVAMIKLSIPMTGLQLASVVVMYLVTITVGGQSAKYFASRQKSLGGMNAFIEEMTSGQKVIKVFCHEDEAEAEFDVKNEELNDQTFKANTYANILMPIMANLNRITYVITAILGGYIAISGKAGLSLGDIAAFLLLTNNFNRPVSMISQQLNSIIMALAGAKRVFDVMDEEPEVDEGKVTLVKCSDITEGRPEDPSAVWAWKCPEEDGSFSYVPLKGDVRFHEVDFGYVEGKTILHDIELFAEPGQKIAFVGSTGAGKTTITNLINRFYDIEDGKIHYDGISINDIKKDDLRRSLGMVLQDTNLFTGTIRENIRYGRLDATDEEVEAAAKLANADSFIETLPDGYDTVINGTGSQLSQGQCQLLAIARCAVANPPVMILDEATSSIDTRTEALIQKGMDKLMEGRTVFVIAHRLSTIQNSDAIMVLENGHIIERGNHDDLIALKGRYYQLYTGNKIGAE